MSDVAAVPDEVVDALAASVAAVIPLLKSRIPAFPAAQLGRIAAPAGSHPSPARWLTEPMLAERLLGALELTIPDLSLDGAPDLTPYLPNGGVPTQRSFLGGRSQGESEATVSARVLQNVRPGAPDLTIEVSCRLSGHRLIAPLLVPETTVPGVGDPDDTALDGAALEQAVAGAHGAGYVALGVAVAWVVAGERRRERGPVLDMVAAAVGLGITVARTLLREVPMPDSYAAALLAKARAEYRLPRVGGGTITVAGSRFALTEGDLPDAADFSGNGLVAVVPGGAVIRTGTEAGPVAVKVEVRAGEPGPPDRASWDEIVEVSWHAEEGLASVVCASSGLLRLTPPWPGDYRLRVYATGRDAAADEERYELHVWAAPPAPEIVHKRTDRLGHRLRGESEPEKRPEPWTKFREICDTVLDLHGTITFVSGATVAEVVRSFGGDPDHPESFSEPDPESAGYLASFLPVATSEGEPGVVVVEGLSFSGLYGGAVGASASGRAASFHQNAKGMTNLAFIEGSRVILSYEPFDPPEADEYEDGEADPAVEEALAGLDFEDDRDFTEKLLYAMERFTGCRIPSDLLEQIQSADVGYRIPE